MDEKRLEKMELELSILKRALGWYHYTEQYFQEPPYVSLDFRSDNERCGVNEDIKCGTVKVTLTYEQDKILKGD